MDRHTQRGMTLVELLIALTLGVVLIAAVIQIYLSSKLSFRLHSAIAELQENGRMAVDFVSDEIRTAGDLLGCRSEIAFTDVINGDGTIKRTISDADHFPHPVVRGYTQGDTIATFNGTPDAGTDILMFYRAGTRYDLAAAMTELSGTNGLSVDPLSVSASDIEVCSSADGSVCIDAAAQDWLLISDFARCALFEATAINGTSSPLTVAHDTGSNQTDRLYDFGNAPPAQVALYGRSFIYVEGGALRIKRCTATACANAISLVDNVANLQIDYGEDTDTFADGSANRYVASANVSNWRRVVSVRVHLLLRSFEDHVTQQAQSYTYYGAAHTAADGALFQAFTATVALRNPT